MVNDNQHLLGDDEDENDNEAASDEESIEEISEEHNIEKRLFFNSCAAYPSTLSALAPSEQQQQSSSTLISPPPSPYTPTIELSVDNERPNNNLNEQQQQQQRVTDERAINYSSPVILDEDEHNNYYFQQQNTHTRQSSPVSYIAVTPSSDLTDSLAAVLKLDFGPSLFVESGHTNQNTLAELNSGYSSSDQSVLSNLGSSSGSQQNQQQQNHHQLRSGTKNINNCSEETFMFTHLSSNQNKNSNTSQRLEKEEPRSSEERVRNGIDSSEEAEAEEEEEEEVEVEDLDYNIEQQEEEAAVEVRQQDNLFSGHNNRNGNSDNNDNITSDDNDDDFDEDDYRPESEYLSDPDEHDQRPGKKSLEDILRERRNRLKNQKSSIKNHSQGQSEQNRESGGKFFGSSGRPPLVRGSGVDISADNLSDQPLIGQQTIDGRQQEERPDSRELEDLTDIGQEELESSDDQQQENLQSSDSRAEEDLFQRAASISEGRNENNDDDSCGSASADKHSQSASGHTKESSGDIQFEDEEDSLQESFSRNQHDNEDSIANREDVENESLDDVEDKSLEEAQSKPITTSYTSNSIDTSDPEENRAQKNRVGEPSEVTSDNIATDEEIAEQAAEAISGEVHGVDEEEKEDSDDDDDEEEEVLSEEKEGATSELSISGEEAEGSDERELEGQLSAEEEVDLEKEEGSEGLPEASEKAGESSIEEASEEHNEEASSREEDHIEVEDTETDSNKQVITGTSGNIEFKTQEAPQKNRLGSYRSENSSDWFEPAESSGDISVNIGSVLRENYSNKKCSDNHSHPINNMSNDNIRNERTLSRSNEHSLSRSSQSEEHDQSIDCFLPTKQTSNRSGGIDLSELRTKIVEFCDMLAKCIKTDAIRQIVMQNNNNNNDMNTINESTIGRRESIETFNSGVSVDIEDNVSVYYSPKMTLSPERDLSDQNSKSNSFDMNPMNLIATDGMEADDASSKRCKLSKNKRKIYASSMYYSDESGSFPTLEQQVERCREISKQLKAAISLETSSSLETTSDDKKIKQTNNVLDKRRWPTSANISNLDDLVQPEQEMSLAVEHNKPQVNTCYKMFRPPLRQSASASNIRSMPVVFSVNNNKASEMFKRRYERMNNYTITNDEASDDKSMQNSKRRLSENDCVSSSLFAPWQQKSQQQSQLGQTKDHRSIRQLNNNKRKASFDYASHENNDENNGNNKKYNDDIIMTDTEYEAPKVRRRQFTPSRNSVTTTRATIVNDNSDNDDSKQTKQQQQTNNTNPCSAGSKLKPFLDSTNTWRDLDSLRKLSPHVEYNEHNVVSPDDCKRLVNDLRAAQQQQQQNDTLTIDNETAAIVVKSPPIVELIRGGAQQPQEAQIMVSKGARIFQKREMQSASWIVDTINSETNSNDNKQPANTGTEIVANRGLDTAISRQEDQEERQVNSGGPNEREMNKRKQKRSSMVERTCQQLVGKLQFRIPAANSNDNNNGNNKQQLQLANNQAAVQRDKTLLHAGSELQQMTTSAKYLSGAQSAHMAIASDNKGATSDVSCLIRQSDDTFSDYLEFLPMVVCHYRPHIQMATVTDKCPNQASWPNVLTNHCPLIIADNSCNTQVSCRQTQRPLTGSREAVNATAPIVSYDKHHGVAAASLLLHSSARQTTTTTTTAAREMEDDTSSSLNSCSLATTTLCPRADRWQHQNKSVNIEAGDIDRSLSGFTTNSNGQLNSRRPKYNGATSTRHEAKLVSANEPLSDDHQSISRGRAKQYYYWGPTTTTQQHEKYNYSCHQQDRSSNKLLMRYNDTQQQAAFNQAVTAGCQDPFDKTASKHCLFERDSFKQLTTGASSLGIGGRTASSSLSCLCTLPNATAGNNNKQQRHSLATNNPTIATTRLLRNSPTSTLSLFYDPRLYLAREPRGWTTPDYGNKQSAGSVSMSWTNNNNNNNNNCQLSSGQDKRPPSADSTCSSSSTLKSYCLDSSCTDLAGPTIAGNLSYATPVATTTASGPKWREMSAPPTLLFSGAAGMQVGRPAAATLNRNYRAPSMDRLHNNSTIGDNTTRRDPFQCWRQEEARHLERQRQTGAANEPVAVCSASSGTLDASPFVFYPSSINVNSNSNTQLSNPTNSSSSSNPNWSANSAGDFERDAAVIINNGRQQQHQRRRRPVSEILSQFSNHSR